MGGMTKRGRRKVEMKPIEKKSDMLVTFSKRSSGIYRKANELAVLCHVTLAIVVFSPSGKPFAFASPSFYSIVHRFTGRNPSREDLPNGLPSIGREEAMRRNEEFNELKALVGSRKVREKELRLKSREKRAKGWWDDPVNDLTREGVHNLIRAYLELQKALDLIIANRGGIPSLSGRMYP